MGEEPHDEPIDVSIKPPVDVTLRAVDPSAQGTTEGPADGLVTEDPVAKATREARESQEGQQEPDVRLGGSPDSPGGELMEEDPVAKATREARESQEGQQEAEPEDIGAVALTTHQLELQKHEDDPEHPRGNPELAYQVAGHLEDIKENDDNPEHSRGNPELAHEAANHIVDIQKNDNNPDHTRGNIELAQYEVEDEIPRLEEHDADPEHTRGNPEMAYFISEAQNAIQSLIANIEAMPSEMISPAEKESRIAGIKAKGEQTAAEAMQEFNREKNLRDILVGAATQRILTQATMGENATGIQLVNLGREGSSDVFIPGQSQSSDKLSNHSTNQTLREVLATAGVDPGVLSDEGWDSAEGSTGHKRRLYDSSIPGFQVLETRFFNVEYDTQTRDQVGEPDYARPSLISIDFVPIDRSAPESQPQNDVTPDSDHVIV